MCILSDLFKLELDQLYEALNTSSEGMTSAAAAEKLKLAGFNELSHRAYPSVFLQALAHSTNFLIAILLMAALISAFTGSFTNALIIVSIVFISFLLDYVQSHRSLVALNKLQQSIATESMVLRQGQWQKIPARLLVPGDLIRLTAGNLVPADAVLIQAKDLHIHEALLTGESLPVKKYAKRADISTDREEPDSLLYSGTSVVSGEAQALVVYTGDNTSFGKLAKSLKQAAPMTEFERGIQNFSRFIFKTVVLLVIFVLTINLLFARPWLESILFSIALAVGLTPELLPMITTVTLATGAVHMARKKVIVKNLAAIQNLGSLDILCSDKTGTLTQGKMSLDHCLDSQGKESEHLLLLAYLNALFSSGINNRDFSAAVLKKTALNPLDKAILQHRHPAINPYEKLDEIPFDFERRTASVLVRQLNQIFLISKGAPESVINHCQFILDKEQILTLDPDKVSRIHQQYQQLSSQGYRVLAVAFRSIEEKPEYSPADEEQLVFAGLLAFLDPPLREAKSVLEELSKKGVLVKILTGDNELVSKTICEQVGLATNTIVKGSEVDLLSDADLAKIVDNTSVFARISPLQKERIIKALRSNGHVVGYMGDGINDAPSLHQADVGISVAGAVDIAREASDIILLQRHLSVLLAGILEGRQSFGNVMKYLMMGTSSNFGNMLSMALAVLFLPFLPMLPTQILLNNLLYDISQISIPTDRVDPGFIRKPRHWNIDLIRQFMLYIGPLSSIFDFLTFAVLLILFSADQTLFHTGWFVESLATQTLVIFVIRTAKKPWESRPSKSLILTVSLIVLIGVYLPFSTLALSLGFTPLPGSYFIFLVLLTLAYLALVEFVKKRLMWRWLDAAAHPESQTEQQP